MRVRGDSAPAAAFLVEPLPKAPGVSLVRFFTDPHPFEETEDGMTTTGYEYNEYHLELQDNGFVAEMVEANYEMFLSRAIQAEGGIEAPQGGDIEERVTALESDVEQIITGLEALAT